MADLRRTSPLVPKEGSESRELEYRIVWPNGNVYAKYTDTRDLSTVLNGLIETLKRMGVPSDYFPSTQARVVHTMYSEWMTSREAEYLLQGNDEL